jgi:arylsulfatase A-like enzyme
MDALKKAGLHEDTYIIFFSDHGDMHGSHGRTLKCVPWEESLRIPFLVAKGNRPCRPDGSEIQHTLINHVDIAPTSLGLCGLEKPSGMGGVDYSCLFAPDSTHPPDAPDSAYLQIVDPGFKFGFAVDRERPWRGLVTSDGWKYAVFEGAPWLMYNLNEDPYELNNVALDGRFRAQRRKLQERLAAWISDTGDSFALPELPW